LCSHFEESAFLCRKHERSVEIATGFGSLDLAFETTYAFAAVSLEAGGFLSAQPEFTLASARGGVFFRSGNIGPYMSVGAGRMSMSLFTPYDLGTMVDASGLALTAEAGVLLLRDRQFGRIAFALRLIVSMARSAISVSRPPSSIRDQPSIAVSGVRSSCETVARNSSFRRLDSSATARAVLSFSSRRTFSIATAARFAAMRMAVACSSP